MSDTIRFSRARESRESSPRQTAAPSTQPLLPAGHPRASLPVGVRGFLLGMASAIVALSLLSGCKSVALPEPLRAGSELSRDRKQRNEEAIRQFERNRNEAEFQAAMNRYAHGDVRGCEDTLRRLLQREPKHREAWLALAELCLSENRLDEAAQAAGAALADWPDDAPTHYTVGLVLDARGRTAEALPHYQRAAQLEPDNELFAVAYHLAAESLRGSTENRQPATADDAPAGVVSADFAARPAGAPSDSSNWHEAQGIETAGYCELSDRNETGAAPPAATSRADSAPGAANGGATAGDAGADDPALARGRAALRAGSFDEALAWFEEAARRRPDDPSVPMAAAAAALKANQPDMASELLEPAQSRFPDAAPIKRLLAVARYRLGDYASSEVLLQQALSLDNTDALSYFFLGCTLEKLGRSDEAQRQFAQARVLEARRRAAP